jgi:hypothetical protein
MCSRLNRIVAPLLISFFLAACASTPVSQGPDPEHLAVAKRFLHSWDAGDLALTVFHRNLEQTYKDQPGVAELVERAFSDVTEEDFENLAARVYVRHLNQEELAELARFTESPTGNRFFRMSVAGAVEGKAVNGEDITRQFNADELAEIVRFSQSDAFVALKEALPTINRELGEEGRQMGEARMREYLERTGQASVGQSG